MASLVRCYRGLWRCHRAFTFCSRNVPPFTFCSLSVPFCSGWRLHSVPVLYCVPYLTISAR